MAAPGLRGPGSTGEPCTGAWRATAFRCPELDALLAGVEGLSDEEIEALLAAGPGEDGHD